MTPIWRHASLLRRLLVLAALLTGLVLMHGVGLGHGTSPVAHASHASTAAQQPGTSGHDATALPPAGTDHGQDSGHTDWAQMCLAVLSTLVVGALFLRQHGSGTTGTERGRRTVGIPDIARTSRPRDGPSLQQLCVMRI